MTPASRPRRRARSTPAEPDTDTSIMPGLEAETFEIDGLDLVIFEVELRPQFPAVLTTAEREVARLACKGHTMAEIAQRRRVHYRTVANQLASIYRKVGVHSSTELTAILLGPKR